MKIYSAQSTILLTWGRAGALSLPAIETASAASPPDFFLQCTRPFCTCPGFVVPYLEAAIQAP